MMRNKIFLVENLEELQRLGWTYLGLVDNEKLSTESARMVCCKEGQFALLTYEREYPLLHYCSFIRFITREQAMELFDKRQKRLQEEEAKLSLEMDAKLSY